jgi:ABC-type methionine transport system ATPase subunit
MIQSDNATQPNPNFTTILSSTPQRPADSDDNRYAQTRIRLRIPKDYCQEPVISHLISEHGVTVNILAALLGADARADGWFDLDIKGPMKQIQSALIYLNELDLEIWYDTDAQTDGW